MITCLKKNETVPIVGAPVGAAFQPLDTALLTVAADGTVTCIGDPAQAVDTYVNVRDGNGNMITAYQFRIFPAATDMATVRDATGRLKPPTYTVVLGAVNPV